METPLIVYTKLLHTLVTINFSVCSLGALLLYLRANGSRARYMLSFGFAVWGIIYLASILTGTFIDSPPLYNVYLLDAFNLVTGTLYLIVLLFYPIEVIRPGWLNLRRSALLLLPYILAVSGYALGLQLTDETPLDFHTVDHLWHHFGEFNVWYRIVLLLVFIGYLFLTFFMTWPHRTSYRQWYQSNYADIENMDINWLRNYGYGILCVALAYFWLLFSGSPTSLQVHTVVVLCFFLYSLFKGLFHTNPYTEDFFAQTLNEDKARERALQREEQFDSLEKPAEFASADGDCQFSDKLETYRKLVEEWMEKEKPYLSEDFKLKDVSRLLSLNRTYLSRIFNEGFGDSFSNVVRNYRMAEAEHLLLTHPEIPVGQISELCGFSSPSAFHRSFVQTHNGQTPQRYRSEQAAGIDKS